MLSVYLCKYVNVIHANCVVFTSVKAEFRGCLFLQNSLIQFYKDNLLRDIFSMYNGSKN